MCKIEDVAVLGSVVLTRLIFLIADYEKDNPGSDWEPWSEMLDQGDRKVFEQLLGQAVKDVLEDTTKLR